MINLLPILLLIFTGIPVSHPLKMSTARIGYDKPAKKITVTINFFIDDFGAHLEKNYRYPSIQFAGGDEKVAKIIEDYVRTKFHLKINNQKYDLLIEKFSLAEENVVQCRFSGHEVKGIRISSMEVHNELLFDAFRNQVNIVKIDLRENETDGHTLRFFPGGATLTVKTDFLCH